MMTNNMKKLILLTILIAISFLFIGCREKPTVPSYLAEYADQFADDPRAANLKWFEEAEYGLFIHYGLYALMEQGEWVQLQHKPEPVPVAEYAKLADQFTAENFDAEFITDFVLEAGMKYITITSKHHDGYSLFETKLSDFQSMNSPCGRDLIASSTRPVSKKASPVPLLQLRCRLEASLFHVPRNRVETCPTRVQGAAARIPL
jgi:alpha-L-fucosidase